MRVITLLFVSLLIFFIFIFFQYDADEVGKFNKIIEYSKQFYLVAVPIMMVWEGLTGRDHAGGFVTRFLSIFIVSIMITTIVVVFSIAWLLVFDADIPELLW